MLITAIATDSDVGAVTWLYNIGNINIKITVNYKNVPFFFFFFQIRRFNPNFKYLIGHIFIVNTIHVLLMNVNRFPFHLNSHTCTHTIYSYCKKRNYIFVTLYENYQVKVELQEATMKECISAQLETVYTTPDTPFQLKNLPSTTSLCFMTKPENKGTKETPKWVPIFLRDEFDPMTMPMSASIKQSKSPTESPM